MAKYFARRAGPPMGRARHTLLTIPFVAAIALLAVMLVAGSTPGSADAATSTVVLHRVNAGGPAVADTPGWVEDSGGSQSAYVNAGSSTTTVGDAIDLNDLSVSPGTLEAMFQSERWDPSASLGGSPVEDLMTPLIAMIFGEPNFSALTFEINESVFRYGSFINAW